MNKVSLVQQHFDSIAKNYDQYKRKNKFYYQNLKKLLSKLIPSNKKVLEVGCATGDLIVYLKPKYGVGVDISKKMIALAKRKNSHLRNIKFLSTWPKEKFEYIFMSDVIEHLEDPERTFKDISKLMGPETLFICTMANPIWEPILMIAEKFRLKMPEGKHKRINFRQIEELLERSNLRIIKHDYKLLIPVYLPWIANFINKYLERYLKRYAFIEYFIAKKK